MTPKEIKRRSKLRSKEEYDVLYVFLKKKIRKRLGKQSRKCRLLFWLYPESVGRCPWTYKVRKHYILVCFTNKNLYEAVKTRMKNEGMKIRENDIYHFFYNKTSWAIHWVALSFYITFPMGIIPWEKIWNFKGFMV